MKISYLWLKEFLCIEESPSTVAQYLTEMGLEVDAVEKFTPSFSNVVIADIKSVIPHPNADKLKIATVFDGNEELQIVCGAPNCRAGMKTALARIGATLTDKEDKKFTIKKGKLRDVESFGMLCGLDELGLHDSSDGIVDWKEDTRAGTDFASLFDDTIFEISLTPNLGHCMSVLGVARELAAKLGEKATLPPLEDTLEHKESMEISCCISEDCPVYAATVVKEIKQVPTPLWMQRRLATAGMRSIDILVDISNYVMLELGQPLHFFDRAKISGNTLSIVTSDKEETIELLNDKTVNVPAGSILIKDNKSFLAIAGVMGGKSSSVSLSTTDIVIEAALFNPSRVRKTAKALDLRSDSSQRFEKGIDPAGPQRAIRRAVYLLKTLCDAKAGPLSILKKEHIDTPRKVNCRTKRINQLLGISLTTFEILEMLKHLEMKVHSQHEDTFILEIPTYRNDIHEEIDIVEEVARMYGLQNFSSSTSFRNSSVLDSQVYLLERKLKNLLVNAGLQEFLTCDLISPELAKLTEENTLPEACEIHVLHPSSVEQSVLRASLLPGLLTSVRLNLYQKNSDIHAFEVGKVHYKLNDQFREHFAAGIVLCGLSRPYHFDPKPKEVDFFDLKGTIENILDALHIKGYHFEISHLKTFHPARQARIKIGEVILGAIGEVHPAKLKELDIDKKVYYAELNLSELLNDFNKIAQINALPIYPGSDRDWTIAVDDKVSVAELLATISKIYSRILFKVNLIDIYKNKNLGDQRKSVTLRLQYLNLEKTLSNEEVEKEHERIIQEVAKKLSISL